MNKVSNNLTNTRQGLGMLHYESSSPEVIILSTNEDCIKVFIYET